MTAAGGPDHGAVVLAYLFLAIGAGIGAWDVWAIFGGNGLRTVSSYVITWSETYPVLPLAVGVLVGHLFWPASIRG